MTPRLRMTLINYFTFGLSFCYVLAIRPCDRRSSLFKLAGESTDQSLLQETDPTLVNVSLMINDLNILDVKNLDIEIDLGMTQKWYDDRLGPDYQTQKLAVLGGIWQPKVTFVVGNTCSKNVQDDLTQFWRGTSNGSVFYSERFLLKPKCTRNFARYPFDVQTCVIKIGSYRFTAEEVILAWDRDTAFEMRVKKDLGEFRLGKFFIYEEVEVRSSGNFSILVLGIRLERHSHREVVQSVLPSLILVKIAYAVFWINLSAIRERILTCQFSLFGTLFIFLNSNHNAADYHFKALDFWFLACLVLILVPLIESIAMSRHLNREEDPPSECGEIEPESDECRIIGSAREWADRLEKILRFLHPLASLCCVSLFFTIFNDNRDDEGPENRDGGLFYSR